MKRRLMQYAQLHQGV